MPELLTTFDCCWCCGGTRELPCTDVAEAGPHVDPCATCQPEVSV